jgi:hypothetical protein
LDLAGIDAAAQPHQPFTGVSLRPALNDANLTFERPDAFRIAIARAGAPRAPLGIIPDPGALKFEDHHLVLRGPRFKYHALPGGKSALYDLDSDPDESTDVQAKYPEVAAKMAAATRERWDAVIASGRAFRMPTAIVRGDTGEAPPNSRSRLTATAAQSLAGSVRIGREAVGFVKPGDSASYALEVVVPGSYEIVLQGEGLDACAPLTLDVGGQTVLPKRISKDAIVFGTCELLKTTTALRVQAGKSKTQAKAAKLRWIVFIPAAPERAGGKSL